MSANTIEGRVIDLDTPEDQPLTAAPDFELMAASLRASRSGQLSLAELPRESLEHMARSARVLRQSADLILHADSLAESMANHTWATLRTSEEYHGTFVIDSQLHKLAHTRYLGKIGLTRALIKETESFDITLRSKDKMNPGAILLNRTVHLDNNGAVNTYVYRARSKN
jgi:hypothetical protein